MNSKALGAVALFTLGVAISCGGSSKLDFKAGAGSAGRGASAGLGGDTGEAGASSGGSSGSLIAQGGGNTGGGSQGGGNQGGGSGDPGAAGDGIDAGAGPGPRCEPFGTTCVDGSTCCSTICDPTTNTCTATVTECAGAGSGCSSPTDCCSLRCDAGACSDTSCVSDGGDCTAGSDCCGGTCTDGLCAPLNTGCLTSGNECAGDGDCCSGACVSGRCSLGASWCIQPGDVCSRGTDCCTGECTLAEGSTLGTCAPAPEGPSFCGGVDGVLCDGCGSCCSRLCAPFGPSGRNVCQPASGCHVTGDLCRKDEDCCGGDEDSGLPGAGNVRCEIEDGKSVGICRNPNSCNPQGNVCHYQDYECSISSARANCCGALGASRDGCQLDPLGVPRCNGLGDVCREPGESCASSSDCCDGVRCVPDAEGALHCGDMSCVMAGGACTINGDCCPGSTCLRPPGSTSGVCGTMTPPPPGTGGAGGTGGSGGSGGSSGGTAGNGGSAGTSGTGGSAGSGGSAGTPPVCSEYGQSCSAEGDCCNDVPCSGNICRFFIP